MRLTPGFIGIVFFIALAFNTNPCSSQARFGPKVGLNFSKLANSSDYVIGNQQIYNGYHFGAISEFRLYGQLFLQPGILITNKGSKYLIGNDTGGGTTGYSYFQFYTFNADIPLNLKYNFNPGSYRIIFTAGPQIGFGLSGKWTASNRTSSKVHFGNDPNDDLKRVDAGLNLGVGLEVGRIQFSTQYYMGLRSLSPTILNSKEQRFKMLSISIACLFGRETKVRRDYENRYLRKHRNTRVTGE
jgi:hypothetical protein